MSLQSGIRRRVILEKCYYGHHRKCKSWEMQEIYKWDPLLGKVPSGKFEKVYCECRCHARHKAPSDTTTR
jgi:hypothetical protein